METTKVLNQTAEEITPEDLNKRMQEELQEKRIACLQELSAAMAPILAKHNMMLDIVVTLSSGGMKTALNVIPQQQPQQPQG